MLDRPLDAVGGRGLFVKELDQALYEGRCELTVHSLKDMPLCPPEELPVLDPYAGTRRPRKTAGTLIPSPEEPAAEGAAEDPFAGGEPV